jgi:hypothetical protein
LGMHSIRGEGIWTVYEKKEKVSRFGAIIP